jgi:PAS domain-containing protein
MPTQSTELLRQLELRKRAAAKLGGGNDHIEGHLTATRAFGVLHAMASSSDTAADAIALLHEMQVHQVELDLQHEEMRSARDEIEAALHRQTQLYDFAPVALYTVDQDATLVELNLRGARLLGHERDLLLGQALTSYLGASSKSVFSALLQRVLPASEAQSCSLDLTSQAAQAVAVQASVSVDPAGGGFLVALSPAGSP